MKCNKIKIILYIHQSLTVILYNTYTQIHVNNLRADSVLHSLRGRKSKKKKRSTLRRSERSQIKRTERRLEGAETGGVFFFCTFGTRLVPFPQDGSIVHERGDVSETELSDGIILKYCLQLEC